MNAWDVWSNDKLIDTVWYMRNVNYCVLKGAASFFPDNTQISRKQFYVVC